MQKLADEISVSKQLIGKIEKGGRSISDEVLDKLVNFFEINNEVTEDYRSFLLKDSMDELEVSMMKIIKINKESKEVEYETTDRDTGERYTTHERYFDEASYIHSKYNLNKEVFIRKIENGLNDVIAKEVLGQKERGEPEVIEQAIIKAEEKLSRYNRIIDIEKKADPYIFEMVTRALSGGVDANPFVKKIKKIINEELEAMKRS